MMSEKSLVESLDVSVGCFYLRFGHVLLEGHLLFLCCANSLRSLPKSRPVSLIPLLIVWFPLIPGRCSHWTVAICDLLRPLEPWGLRVISLPQKGGSRIGAASPVHARKVSQFWHFQEPRRCRRGPLLAVAWGQAIGGAVQGSKEGDGKPRGQFASAVAFWWQRLKKRCLTLSVLTAATWDALVSAFTSPCEEWVEQHSAKTGSGA